MRPYYSTSFRSRGSNILKNLVWVTAILSFAGALLEAIFPKVFGIPGPQTWLSLSPWGIKNHFYWQIFTYFFVAPYTDGLSLGFFIYLLFNCYFLSIIGKSLIESKGLKDFLYIYIGGGVLAGVVATLFFIFTPAFTVVAGQTTAIYALLTAWMILVPEMQVLLFFTIPVKVKWLIAGILGMNLLIDLSHGSILNFSLYFSSIVFGYLYGVCVWKTNSPFKILHSFESLLMSIHPKRTQKNESSWSSTSTTQSRGKRTNIYDFKTGNIIQSDEEFIEECLSKIASKGKKSLTLLERLRLRKISKKTKQKTK